MHLKYKNLIFLCVLATVALLAFCTHITKLGFYLDDWVILQAFNQDGNAGIINYATGDSRPFVAWVWIVGSYLFGSKPLGWQIYSLLFRLLTVFTVWLISNKFFPTRPLRSLVISLLFFIYPIFIQQSVSLAFVHHWIAFSFFLLSLYFQILALESKRYFNYWLIVALVINGIQLFTNEYFSALELSRPLIIGIYLYQVGKLSKLQWKRIVNISLPFILLLLTFISWRFFLISLPVEDRNTPTMITAVFTTPIYAARRWLEMFLQSMIEGLLGSWYHALNPSDIVFKPFTGAISWILAVLSASLLIPTFFWFDHKQQIEKDQYSESWHHVALALGFILMVLGFLPGWGIGRTIADQSGLYNDRFGLPAALGASLLLVSLFEWLIKNKKVLLVIFAALIGVGIGYQYRIQLQYVDSWSKQKEFSWQLLNRAPGIQENTAIISNRVIAAFVGSWADTSAVNQLYDPFKKGENNAYWYYSASKIPLDYLIQHYYSITERIKFLKFNGSLKESIVIMNPTASQCLWVLDTEDATNPYIDGILRQYLIYSVPERIIPSGSTQYNKTIWGEKTCRKLVLTFMRMQSVRFQEENFPQVIELYIQAQENGFAPGNPVEFSPFIEAYAMDRQWDRAISLTKKAQEPIQITVLSTGTLFMYNLE